MKSLILPKKSLADKYRKITVPELKFLGYELGRRQMPIGDKPYRYGIVEIVNEDNTRIVSFCYLYSTIDKTGIILTHSFDYYLKHEVIL